MFSLSLREDVVLKPLAVWHVDEWVAHMARGTAEHIRPWVGAGFVAETPEAAKALIQRYAERSAQDVGGLYGIWRSGKLIGGVLFVSIDTKSGVCEVGCWLEPGEQGGGIITDACTAQLDWIFNERGLHRAEWHCRADNEKSIAVAKRLGMREEGVLRQNWVYRDERFDTMILSVLKPEWDARDR